MKDVFKFPFAVAALALAGLCAWGFYAVLPAVSTRPFPAYGLVSIPIEEIRFYALYAVFGSAFVPLCAWLLGLPSWRSKWSLGGARRWAVHPATPWLLAGFAAAASSWAAAAVLRYQPVTDDEAVYEFIARTLAQGHLINPLPQDPGFYFSHFVLMNSRGWFGKYPLGHALVLLPGILTGMSHFLVAVMGGATAYFGFQLGRRLLGPRRALLASLLLALSPHFVLTFATLLSQTTACFLTTAGLWALAEAAHKPKLSRWWLAGLAFALGCLTRPMPFGFFAAAGAWWALSNKAFPKRQRLAQLGAFGAPVLASGALLLWVNWLQQGDPLTSGYQAVHGSLGVLNGGLSSIARSVFFAALRENFWLFGWPWALPLLLFARPKRGAWLLWSPLLGQLAYRILIPKTVVSSTGPIYLMETVPVFALLASDGLLRLQIRFQRVRKAARPSLAPWVAASTLASAVFFLPQALGALSDGAAARERFFAALDEQRVHHAVVFSNAMVRKDQYQTWAYQPGGPYPGEPPDRLVVRIPQLEDPFPAMLEFWQRRFPDRTAYWYHPDSTPPLKQLRPPATAP